MGFKGKGLKKGDFIYVHHGHRMFHVENQCGKIDYYGTAAHNGSPTLMFGPTHEFTLMKYEEGRRYFKFG